MKKILLVLFMLIFSLTIVKADCSKAKHDSYVEYANKITYDNNYSKSKGKFNVTIYNVIDEMYAKYNGKKYTPNSENIIEIEDINEGTNVTINIFGNDGCSAVRKIDIKEPYYNQFYKSGECYGYEDKLTMCSSQFTSTKVTLSLLEKSKKNYDNVIVQDKEQEKVEELTFYQRIKNFMLNWGIKIGLLLITSVITFAYFNEKYIKVKHGI